MMLGCFPDPDDPRDLDFASARGLASALPNAADVLQHLRTPYDQGSIGSCVANAVAQALHVSHKKQYVLHPRDVSRLAIYYLSRATHRAEAFDSGTHIRATFRILNKFGFCPEEVWPYDVGKFAVKPGFRVFSQSFDQSAGQAPASYWRVYAGGEARVAAVRTAIADGFAVVFGTDVGSVFMSGKFDSSTTVDPRDGDTVGGHAMVLCGYDPASFTLVNSWGTGWGNAGFARVSVDFVATGTRDVWVVEHAPPYAQGGQ